MKIKVVENKKLYNFYDQCLVPNRLRFDKKIYKIEKIPSKQYIIDEFTIVTEEDKIKELLIHNCWHPNASSDPNLNHLFKSSSKPPKNQKFCLPLQLININITKDNINNFIGVFNILLKTYNYEHSYWIKWDGFIFI